MLVFWGSDKCYIENKVVQEIEDNVRGNKLAILGRMMREGLPP